MQTSIEPIGSVEIQETLELADEPVELLMARARQVRDCAWGTTITFSPKVFLPLTNLCKNFCDYCSFRRSPKQAGMWTMRPDEVDDWLLRGRQQHCVEALFCLGDKPESTFESYRDLLAGWGFSSTVDYLGWAGRQALGRDLLPHTNAGILSLADMTVLKSVNVSLGLMLESASDRLCEPGQVHHHAPDKRPAVRIQMIDEAGQLKIPFTTGILIGIGETLRERVEALFEIRRLHRAHGHIQEVIVQNFRAHVSTQMAAAMEPPAVEVGHTVALARLILDPEISLQAPPNLNHDDVPLLVDAGINDLGGISPLTPDYINPGHPWPHLQKLASVLYAGGFSLRPRLPIYDSYVERPDFLDEGLRDRVIAAKARMQETRWS